VLRLRRAETRFRCNAGGAWWPGLRSVAVSKREEGFAVKLGPVDHITLNVTDIKAATRFFEGLGMGVEGTLDGGEIVFLSNGDAAHPLQHQLDTVREDGAGGTGTPGLNHIAFFVEDVEGASDEVRKGGVPGLHEPFYQGRSGRTIFTFEGPDGVGLQFARKEGRGEYEDFG